MTSTIDMIRTVLAPLLVVMALVLGAGVAGAQTEAEPAGYLGGSSNQGPQDINPSVVVPVAADAPVAENRALALTGTDIAVTLVVSGAALVVVGLFVVGGTRLVSRRR